jgi:hypothetical protein
MSQRPSAVSLMLCDQVIFEEGTQKPYLLGIFTGVAVDGFPTPAQRFDVFAALTDGSGEVALTLSVVHLDVNQEIYTQQLAMRFTDPLRVVNLRFRVRQLIFEAPGTYLFALHVDEEEIAARRIRVYQTGETP